MTFEVGEYQAIEKIGSGASADVWRGIRTTSGAPVALKILRSGDLGQARREAALTAAVDHPHVPAILDVFAEAGRVVLVTELAAGGSLEALLDDRRERGLGPLPGQQVLTVLLPIAAVLATAHERDVIHGDLSTGNVLFDVAGRPMLADLGAGRAAAERGLPVRTTAEDAAPELAKGGVPTPATDLFALGSVGLACLTGRHAWPAEDLHDVLIQSTAGQWPDPGDVEAHPVLIGALRSLLDPNPKKRPAAAALIMELQAAGDPEPVELPSRRTTSSAPRPDPDGTARSRASTVLRNDRVVHGPPPNRPDRRRFGGFRSVARHRSGPESMRADPAGPTPRKGSVIRWAAAATATLLLVGLAVWAGLWWSEQAPGGASAVSAAPGVTGLDGAPVTPIGSATAEGGKASTVPPSVAETSSPAGRSGTGKPVPPPAPKQVRKSVPTTSQPLPGRMTAQPKPVPPPAPRQQVSPDWTTIVTGLDRVRGQALVGRDPRMLDAVYTPTSPDRAKDAALIATLRSLGYHLAGASHQVLSVTVVATSPAIKVAVVDELPAYALSDPAGQEVGTTQARGIALRMMVLVRTPSGYRISSVTGT